MAADTAWHDRVVECLRLHLEGKSNREIVEQTGVPKSTVSDWINAAYDAGIMGKLPHPTEFNLRLDHSLCATKPILVGDPTVCVTCVVSGYDFHPRLRGKPLPRDRRRYTPDPRLEGGR